MSKILLFEKSLQKLNILYKYSGINLRNKITKPIDILKYRTLLIFNLLWSFSAIVVSIFMIILGVANNKSFIEITSVAPCTIFSILAMMKSIALLFNEKNVQELIALIIDLELKENDRKEDESKQEIIDQETGLLNAVINVLYILNCSMLVVFDMTPFILIAIKYYQTNEFEMMLPYMDVFEFIPYELKYWPFAYIHQIWSECIVLLEMGAADYLFFTCCTYIRIQFKLLSNDFESIIPSRSISRGEVLDKTEFRAKFAKLVRWHQDLIHSTKIVEIIYSKSTLCNFVSSSIVICLTGFNVTIADDIELIITFLTFLFMGLLQVFFLCFFADMLMSAVSSMFGVFPISHFLRHLFHKLAILVRASMEVSNAVYNCQWYLAKPSVGKQLLIVQTRAQEPCKLTAAGFADVNLRAFMRVLSTAWSYFALLHTVYSEK